MIAELLTLTAPNTYVRFQGALLSHVCLLDACLRLCEQKELCNHLVLSMIREAPASPGSFPCFSILLGAYPCNAPAFSLSLALDPPYRTVIEHIPTAGVALHSVMAADLPLSAALLY